MLRSKKGQNPAFFQSDLFYSTPLPRYKQVSCTSIILPPDILLLNNECMYIVFISLRNLDNNETRGNKIVFIPNNVTTKHRSEFLIDLMNDEIKETTLRDVIEKTSVIYSIDHLKLFLNVVEFFKHVNRDLYNLYFDELQNVVEGHTKFNKERVNEVTRDLSLYLLNRSDWFINYERYVNFRLSHFVKIDFSQTTKKFRFQYIGSGPFEVVFHFPPFEAHLNNAQVEYNKLFMWFGLENNIWNCSRDKVRHIMPRISNIHHRFGFLKIYISFVDRNMLLGSDINYDKLLTIINLDKKSNYFNLTDSYVNISPYADLLKCECIIKTDFDEIVQFAESNVGTTIIFAFK